MLKHISPLMTPELLKILAEMGHGDEIVLADANFPAAAVGKRCIRLDGHGGCEVMRAIVDLMPLDDFVPSPVAMMQVPKGKLPNDEAPIAAEYLKIAKTDLKSATIERMEHEAFIRRARDAFAVVQTGETALYANVLLRKGVIRG